MDASIDEQVVAFLNTNIGSVAQLEILLLLQTNPAQAWSAADIARELRIETAGAQQQLALLMAARLIKPAEPDRFVYAPDTLESQSAVTALAQAYLLRRVSVIGIIHAKPATAPSPGIRAFSDAFNLRKDPNAPRG